MCNVLASVRKQWRAFLRRLGDEVPAEPDFASVLAVLEDFLGNAVEPWADGRAGMVWQVGGPWRSTGEGE